MTSLKSSMTSGLLKNINRNMTKYKKEMNEAISNMALAKDDVPSLSKNLKTYFENKDKLNVLEDRKSIILRKGEENAK